MITPSKETLLKSAEKMVSQVWRDNGDLNCNGVTCRECPLYHIDDSNSCRTKRYLIKYINKHKGEQVKELPVLEERTGVYMLTWDDDEAEAEGRVVIARVGSKFLALGCESAERYMAGGDDELEMYIWHNAKPIPEVKEITMADIEEKFGCKVKIVEGGE
jgi:hypothetical protein